MNSSDWLAAMLGMTILTAIVVISWIAFFVTGGTLPGGWGAGVIITATFGGIVGAAVGLVLNEEMLD